MIVRIRILPLVARRKGQQALTANDLVLLQIAHVAKTVHAALVFDDTHARLIPRLVDTVARVGRKILGHPKLTALKRARGRLYRLVIGRKGQRRTVRACLDVANRHFGIKEPTVAAGHDHKQSRQLSVYRVHISLAKLFKFPIAQIAVNVTQLKCVCIVQKSLVVLVAIPRLHQLFHFPAIHHKGIIAVCGRQQFLHLIKCRIAVLCLSCAEIVGSQPEPFSCQRARQACLCQHGNLLVADKLELGLS